MLGSLLLALDGSESGQTALAFTIGLAAATGSQVKVLHVRELSTDPRIRPTESKADARRLVDEAVLSLRLAGIRAQGQVSSERDNWVARRIVDESTDWHCDAIILGSRRLRGLHRLAGRRTREQVLRRSPLPVITAPAPAFDGAVAPLSLSSLGG
jgi:nucleotide-binding universal stress UspA family protein